VTEIGALGTTLAATSNRRVRRFLQEPQGVTSQKTAFLIVTAVKTSNVTFQIPLCSCLFSELTSIAITPLWISRPRKWSWPDRGTIQSFAWKD
jgi:hypothetical protein